VDDVSDGSASASRAVFNADGIVRSSSLLSANDQEVHQLDALAARRRTCCPDETSLDCGTSPTGQHEQTHSRYPAVHGKVRFIWARASKPCIRVHVAFSAADVSFADVSLDGARADEPTTPKKLFFNRRGYRENGSLLTGPGVVDIREQGRPDEEFKRFRKTKRLRIFEKKCNAARVTRLQLSAAAANLQIGSYDFCNAAAVVESGEKLVSGVRGNIMNTKECPLRGLHWVLVMYEITERT